MLNLTRSGIRSFASSDINYYRGLLLYKGNNVKSAAYSKINNQYKLIVNDVFEYVVTINCKDMGEFSFSCNCPAHLKEKGACKHSIAALLFMLKYQEKQSMKAPQTIEERRAYSVLEYFSNQEDNQTPIEIFHIEPIINIPSMIKANAELPSLSLRVGSGKYYKVQSLKRFILDYKEKNNIILGKEFKFIYNESEFDHNSMEIINFLLELYDVQVMTESQSSAKLFLKSQLFLTHSLLMRLLRIINKNPFQLILYGRVFENTRFFMTNPNIRYDLDVVDDAIVLDYRDRDAVVPLSESGDLIYYNGAVFAPDSRFRKNYIPFFNNLGKNKQPLIFRNDNKQRFLEEVLPKLHDSMDIEIPEELKDRYLYFDLETSIYFDKYKNGIQAKLIFKYGEYEFNCFEAPKSDFYIIIRQKEKEDEIMCKIESFGFEAHSSFYFLKQDSAIFEFLNSSNHDLSIINNIYYSEDFKKLRLKSAGRMKLNMNVNRTNNLLEFNVEYEDVPKEELRELFRSIKVKKKYFRLKDGSFIDLTDPNLVKVSEVFDDLNIKSNDISGDIITLNNSQAFYLESAFKDYDCVTNKNEDFIKLIDGITMDSTNEYDIPNNINADVRTYQKTGYSWLRMLANNSLGGILADDMGLGKTLQAIIYMSANKTVDTHYLIVCPSSICYNWLDEIESFCPTLSAQVINGTPNERQEYIQNYANYDILITSYPLIRRDIMYYREINFHTIFLDEAQFIKNAASLSAQSVKLLNGLHRFALTGTPIENSLSELWSIFDFLMPGFLFSHTKFVNRYEKPIAKEDKSAFTSLNMRIKPFIMRRMKKDVLKELPSKIEEKIVTEMTEEQKMIYLSYLENVRGELFDEINESGIEKVRIKVLAALTRLRQICCHPSTFLEDYHGGSGKLNLLLEVVQNAISNDHRILLFSQFTSMLAIIAKELDALGIEYFVLEGSTPMSDRMDYVKRFNNGEKQIFLISLKTGGTGLNLTGADTVIHYDPWWNPAVEDQATDRAYRIGQTNNVYVLKLLTKTSIEEKIYKLQHKKRELSDSVIGKGEVFLSNLSKEELMDIFS